MAAYPKTMIAQPETGPGMVVDNSTTSSGALARFEDLMVQLNLGVVPFDAGMAGAASRPFGRGNHPAKLNFGGCFSYALAKKIDEPLLLQDNDFVQTDIRPALA